jgi:hypothetical protein
MAEGTPVPVSVASPEAIGSTVSVEDVPAAVRTHTAPTSSVRDAPGASDHAAVPVLVGGASGEPYTVAEPMFVTVADLPASIQNSFSREVTWKRSTV